MRHSLVLSAVQISALFLHGDVDVRGWARTSSTQQMSLMEVDLIKAGMLFRQEQLTTPRSLACIRAIQLHKPIHHEPICSGRLVQPPEPSVYQQQQNANLLHIWCPTLSILRSNSTDSHLLPIRAPQP